MRAISLLVVLLILVSSASFLRAETQQAGINARGIVESAEISGVDEDEISEDVRNAVRKLAGKPFDQDAADDLIVRIQAEKPEFIATTRLIAGDESDRVKVVFLLVKRNAEAGEGNVNSRYTVERVDIQGFDESRLSQSIRDEIQKLVGEKLDQDKAGEIQHRLEDELRPKRYVVKRVIKGSDRQHVVVIYEVRNVRFIPFIDQPPQHILYHSKENFSAVVSADIVDKSSNRLFFGLADDQDQLLERFAGFNVGFETTKVGTDRLGLALRYSRYHDRWQPSTVSADQNAIYRERSTFDPSITFGFDPRIRLTAGFSLSDLQMQYPDLHNANANAVVASLNFQNVWGNTGDDRHSLQAGYDFRAGNHKLDSDFIYTRHSVQAQYAYDHNRNRLLVKFAAGTIAGNAPLLERFSLGDTSTLRGWNKFDVAPLGGNRMIHATLQYGIRGPHIGAGRIQIDPQPKRQLDIRLGLHVFYDVGAVGDRGSPIKARHSVGFGIGPVSSGFFLQLGFPIRSERVAPIFITGFRF